MIGRLRSTRIGVAWLAAAALAGVHPPLAAQSPTQSPATTPPATATQPPAATPPAPTMRRPADAQPPIAHAAALAAGCTPCHRPGVRGIPSLDGQTREALRAKLLAFREGTLAGTVMPQLARGYTPAELDVVAGWFAAGGAPR